MTYSLEKLRSYLAGTSKEYCFVTISGAHAYGFPSQDSDLDLRGSHFPSLPEALRYSRLSDTFEESLATSAYYPNEMDLVSHSLLKYIHLMIRQPNGYILEQLYSPLVVATSPMHEELKQLALLTVSKEMKYHYGCFYRNQQSLMQKKTNKEIKLVLYQLRILASASFLAKTGRVEVNLPVLNEELKFYDPNKLQELIELKTVQEKSDFADPQLREYWLKVLDRRLGDLDKAFDESALAHFDRSVITSMAEDLLARYFRLHVQKDLQPAKTEFKRLLHSKHPNMNAFFKSEEFGNFKPSKNLQQAQDVQTEIMDLAWEEYQKNEPNS